MVPTLLGKCLSEPRSFKSRVSEEEDKILSFKILNGLFFAFVSSPSCSIQLRFGYIWSSVAGKTHGAMTEIELFDDERITQVSGVTGTN